MSVNLVIATSPMAVNPQSPNFPLLLTACMPSLLLLDLRHSPTAPQRTQGHAVSDLRQVNSDSKSAASVFSPSNSWLIALPSLHMESRLKV